MNSWEWLTMSSDDRIWSMEEKSGGEAQIDGGDDLLRVSNDGGVATEGWWMTASTTMATTTTTCHQSDDERCMEVGNGVR
ncbi:hypothetical protein GUJ93_ZPchr0006g41872 [Zizania palustris]|uniref:Uncharacterized protein n=1 Tax=Zizania palustris TaxID=103762 RepID=A0A8J5SMS0_ZIZPA|nr:hypothetical protein GUJ93_ZPchr0006g41872 [Zizania palustris]